MGTPKTADVQFDSCFTGQNGLPVQNTVCLRAFWRRRGGVSTLKTRAFLSLLHARAVAERPVDWLRRRKQLKTLCFIRKLKMHPAGVPLSKTANPAGAAWFPEGQLLGVPASRRVNCKSSWGRLVPGGSTAGAAWFPEGQLKAGLVRRRTNSQEVLIHLCTDQ